MSDLFMGQVLKSGRGDRSGFEVVPSLMGSDLNNDNLEFAIEDGPDGMEIYDDIILWTPTLDQVGTHTVNVSISDGYETVSKEFEVEVIEEEVISKPDENGSPILLIIIVIILVLVLVGAGIGVFLYMKNKGKPEPIDEKNEEETPAEDTGPPEEEKQAYDQLYGQP